MSQAQLDRADALLAQAKATYVYRLVQIDGLLQSAVSRDPANLTDAQSVQTDYTAGLTGATLAASVYAITVPPRHERGIVADVAPVAALV